MAKILLSNLSPPATTRSRGNFLIIDGKSGPVAQAWPRPRGRAKTPYQKYHEAEFAINAAWASDPEPVMLMSAQNIAQGSDQVARDILMMAQVGNFYTFTFDDGTTSTRYRDVAPNAQLILEQITSTIGSLIYRNDDYWEGLAPGLSGFVLTVHNGKPLWLPPSTGSGGIISWGLYDVAGSYTYAWPTTAQKLETYIIGGGGGGGAGRRGAAGTSCAGGGGGGAAGITRQNFRTAGLPSTLSVLVGAGAVGGAATTTDNTNGLGGAIGGNSSITIGSFVYQSGGGGNANGGTTGGGAFGTGNAQGAPGGSSGGSGGAGANGAAGANSNTNGATGGGGGAGQGPTTSARNGGNGGSYAVNAGMSGAVATGGIGSTKTAAIGGLSNPAQLYTGQGGGGGYAALDGTAGDGGAGGQGGGGGGGGGGSLNGHNSGAGGRGGDGLVLIIAY